MDRGEMLRSASMPVKACDGGISSSSADSLDTDCILGNLIQEVGKASRGAAYSYL